jgi:hypothetical protein
MFDGYIACGDCIRSNPESYIEILVNNSSAANTILDEATLEDEGWKKHDEKYETGFHHGQTDDPAKVLKRFNIKGYDVIFHIDQNSQFYTVWQAFIKEME